MEKYSLYSLFGINNVLLNMLHICFFGFCFMILLFNEHFIKTKKCEVLGVK